MTRDGDRPELAAAPGKPQSRLLRRTAIAAAVVFLVVAIAAPFGPFAFEADLLRNLRSPADAIEVAGPRWVGSLMRDVTALGGSPIVTLFTVLLGGFFLVRREWPRLAFVVVVVVGQTVIVSALKAAFGRERPAAAPHLAEVASPSFPSGHAASAATIFLLAALLAAPLLEHEASRRYVFATAALLALLIGLSRAFLGVHYPSDVVAGWSFGVAWTCACALAARRWA